MDRIINDNNDTFKPTQTGRGVDISSQRADDLDNHSLTFLEQCAADFSPICAIDLGGGYGAHSVRMAQAGAHVLFIDMDCAQAKAAFAQVCDDQLIDKNRIDVLAKDFRDVQMTDIPENYTLLYSQRALHYLPYAEASRLLSMLFQRLRGGGKAFLSVAGYDTEYGQTYPDRQKPVQERFALVAEDMRIKHGIEHPIVTYTEDEFKALLESAGFAVESIKSSAFGNIKAVAVKHA